MADYNSAYTGAEIDQGVGNGLAAPTTYAPKAHDDANTTYGKGTDTKYGHLKLSASTSSTSGTSDGIAATPSAVKAAYDLANGKQSPATTLAGYGITDAATSADLGTFVRPNLLDNWYFVGGGSQQNGGQFPINQRGETTYKRTTEYLDYCIDRWIQRDNNRNGQGITLQSDGLAINFSGNGIQGISQAIEDPSKLLGKTVTFSVLFGSRTGRMWIGLWWSATAGLQTTSIQTLEVSSALPSVTVTLPASIPSGSSYLNVSVMTYAGNTPTAKVLAAKLELGDTQTLAHQENGTWVLNEIPNFQQELARCQRFYQTYRTQSLRPSYAADCRPVMRTDPTQSTITVDSTTYYVNSADL